MPCYGPIPVWYAKERNENGKFSLVFNGAKGSPKETGDMYIPCGQCIGCRIDKQRQWAVRILHEAKMYEDNCFLTLSYDDKYLPEGGTLVKRDLQLFFKRLRYFSGRQFRYFGVGEYGDEKDRPHYHCILFGFKFEDQKYWSNSQDGYRQYRSDLLERAWTFGHSLIGNVTTASAQYVSKYVVKKVTGDKAVEHYGSRIPEFALMSRRPGLGASWVDKFASDVFPSDFVVVDGGKRVKVPRYYLDRQKDEPLKRAVKRRRILKNKDNPNNEWYRRGEIEEYVKISGDQFKLRRLENDAARLRGIR